MKPIYCSPSQVPKETVVFILPRAGVSIKMNAHFANSMVLEVMMNVAYRGVNPFSNVTCLVNKVVNLLRHSFAHDAKDSTFAWCFEINRSRPHWVRY